MTAAYLAVRIVLASQPPWLLRDRRRSSPDDAASAVLRELDTTSTEEAVGKAKDDEVRRLIENEHYEDAGRLILHYYHDTFTTTP